MSGGSPSIHDVRGVRLSSSSLASAACAHWACGAQNSGRTTGCLLDDGADEGPQLRSMGQWREDLPRAWRWATLAVGRHPPRERALPWPRMTIRRQLVLDAFQSLRHSAATAVDSATTESACVVPDQSFEDQLLEFDACHWLDLAACHDEPVFFCMFAALIFHLSCASALRLLSFWLKNIIG